MSQNYLPFFRKYRPQAFKDLVGQDYLVKTLSAAIETGKISHAYLFCGPRGTGKTSSARIFAKSLNCKDAPTLTPCQTCQSCVDITNSIGVDVVELDAATNRGIDDAKSLIEQTQYAPMNGKYKIFIIDEAHMLTKEAFNALLKTLEEPPKNVIFILATTEPHKIIETIVSRCQRFDFRRITTDDIVKKLKEVSELEKIKITEEALFTIAKNVSGGLRDSLALLDQVSILGQKEEITKETIEELLGKITFDVLYNITDTIIKGDIENSIKNLNEIYKRGNEPRNFSENLIEFLRNAIIIKSTKEKDFDFAKISTSEAEKISQSNWDKNKLINLLDKTIEFYKEIRNATNPYLWSEILMIELCGINEIKDRKEQTQPALQNFIKPQTRIIEQPQPIKEEKIEVKVENKTPIEIEKTEEKIENTTPLEAEVEIKPNEIKKEEVKEENTQTKAEEQPSVAPVSTNQASGDSTDIKVIWANIINSITNIPAKFFFSGISKLINIDDSTITLGFLNQNFIEQARSESKSKALKDAIKEIFTKEMNVQFILITKDTKVVDVKIQPQKNPPKRNYNEETPKPKDDSTKENSEADKTENFITYSSKTKEMLENFNGKVID